MCRPCRQLIVWQPINTKWGYGCERNLEKFQSLENLSFTDIQQNLDKGAN
jgi:hypothetical protein